jgi:hypothetical protein
MGASGEAKTEIMPGNTQIWLLLRLMSNQWLCSAAGIYGINFSPIMEAAQHQGMNIDRFFLEKVNAFENAALQVINGKDEGCNEKKKKQCEAEFGLDNMDWICKNCEEMKSV